jgi:hypothetical protein
MDGGVTLETEWCQAKSASLQEKNAPGMQISFTRLADTAVPILSCDSKGAADRHPPESALGFEEV